MAEIRVTGLEEMQRKLTALGEKFPKEIRSALFIEAETIMTDSKTNYVPVDLGMLKSTGHVIPPEHRGGELITVLSYGGPAAPYAEEQHEELGYWHDKGQAKYLEVPLFIHAARLIGNIARRIRLGRMI
jgi:hypothetical protein